MGYLNFETAKSLFRMSFFKKRFYDLKKLQFFLPSLLKIGFYRSCEILHFSNVFVLRPTAWAMRTVKLQTVFFSE